MKISKCYLVILIFMSGIVLSSCSSVKKSNMNKNEGSVGVSSPPAIVYKTSGDYFNNVPVVLSADKKKIVSYPAQSDIRKGDDFVYPTKLSEGYLLDNRGISPNAAFLRFSYEDYYNMDNIPTAERLMEYIIDDEPFTEYYEVGKRNDYKDIAEELNTLIEGKKLKKFKNLCK